MSYFNKSEANFKTNREMMVYSDKLDNT